MLQMGTKESNYLMSKAYIMSELHSQLLSHIAVYTQQQHCHNRSCQNKDTIKQHKRVLSICKRLKTCFKMVQK